MPEVECVKNNNDDAKRGQGLLGPPAAWQRLQPGVLALSCRLKTSERMTTGDERRATRLGTDLLGEKQ